MASEHDWLKLIDISGPFLAEPAIKDCFPPVLDEVDSSIRKRLRSTYDEWQDATTSEAPDADLVHDAWVETILTELLSYREADLRSDANLPTSSCVSLSEHDVTLTPSYALVNKSEGDECLLMIDVLAANQDLDETIQSGSLVTTPTEKMVALLRGSSCPLGLITNGEQWRLVHASVGETVSHATWRARLWLQESETLRAFAGLLRVGRFYGQPDGKLPALFEKSKEHQSDVTETLGDQVARAIEVLVRALDRADEERNRELLADVPPPELYEAGLTVMMRLVFLLAAEERGLILLGDPKYDAFYALSNLRGQLKDKTDAQLDHDHEAWSRLLALFRLVYGGVRHPSLQLPALGGSLFDPDRFPFLEGRLKGTSWKSDTATPLPIDDRTVLFLLEAIQLFQGRSLSYAGLDVEQIGHVYEGLLEKTVRRVDATTLHLKQNANAKEPFVTFEEIKEAEASGESAVADLLSDRSSRQASTIKGEIDSEKDDGLVAKLLTTCRGNDELASALKPYVKSLAIDNWGYPLVHPKGSFVVGLGQDRRQSGSHYTPKSLTEKIVEETLTPVAFVGPAEGKPREDWKLKSAEGLLDLKVCDPAMGSGAFLVQVCRWLSDRLVEAWSLDEENGQSYDVEGRLIAAGAEATSEPLPNSPDERAVIARRVIAEKCLYGVDMNPLAVELAKLSLWLTTLSKGHPFGFLDHNLKCGNSLLGIDDVNQVIDLSMTPAKTKQARLFGRTISNAVEEATQIRLALRDIPIRDIRGVEAMANMDDESRELLQLPMLLADALVGIELAESKDKARNERIQALAGLADDAARGNESIISGIRTRSHEDLATDAPTGVPRRPFHWALEFPEVFGRDNGGFDAIVGNPPFLGGHRITAPYGTAFREWLVRNIANKKKGAADLVVYFFLSAYRHLREGGAFGLLAVNTIAEGDSRQVGLEPMLKGGAVIYTAHPNEAWPGRAAVVTSRVHVYKGNWLGHRSLLGKNVRYISAFLSDREEWSPKTLKSMEGLNFQGTAVTGMGFVLEPDEALRMLDADSRNTDVLFPYLNGQDLNTDPEQKPSRWVINFWDWPEERAATYRMPFEHVQETVKPERQRRNQNGKFVLGKGLRKNWWLHNRPRPALYHAIGRGKHFEKHPAGWDAKNSLGIVFVAAQTGKYLSISPQPAEIIFSHMTSVFASNDLGLFANLNSTFHIVWTFNYAGKFETRLKYYPSDCFENFPLVDNLYLLRNLGRRFQDQRLATMKNKGVGLTNFYNQVHSATVIDKPIEEFRDVQRELDDAVASAYGWNDLNLQHDFHKLAYLPENDNIRFTISEDARIEILHRLADLNKLRYEEEVAQGLHGNKPAKKKTSTRGSRSTPSQNEMDV